MLLWLADLLQRYSHSFEVFHYITLRSILTAVTAFVVSLLFGPAVIRRLTLYKVGQQVRDDGPKSHLSKAGTPTMGGILVLIAASISTLLWGDLTNRYLWLVFIWLHRWHR
jgi:phospho-N-acetylmuramoyl-pentapeptide-transferase